MLRISAILVVRNGALTLPRVLSHLADNEIDVYVIDHGSVDRTPTILAEASPTPVVEVTRVGFDGVHRWRRSLDQKVHVAESISDGWIIHLDADEIMESPREGEGLREMIERMDRVGTEMIECDEMVFVPTDEAEDHSRGDFVATMRNYYYFAPPGRLMQRVLRAGCGPVDWARSGGHSAGARRLASVERIRLRHYVGLSLNHLRQQYLGRVFGAEELRRGWHRKRVATTPEFIVAPPFDRLFDLDRDGWRIDAPEKHHLVFNQPKAYIPPNPVPPAPDHRPMPFVVGVGRSGTTLLRLMLDSHPDLAMTPETHWLKGAVRLLSRAPEDVGALREFLMAHDSWREMHLTAEELDEILERHDSDLSFDTLRSIFHRYARRHGASRVGDKTPLHGLWMTDIARVFPESRFIHLVRDGRDVAVSHRDVWFGPEDDPVEAAIFWLWRIREMRQQAEFLPHYLEVRYEDLVHEPETVLRTVGEFIEVPFHPNQLDAHQRASERLTELVDRNAKGRIVGADERRWIHRRTSVPPDRSRVERWKREMSPADLEVFERIAGIMLLDLGYPLSTVGSELSFAARPPTRVGSSSGG